MSEKNNFKKNKQQTKYLQEIKKVQEERKNEYFLHLEPCGVCLPSPPNASINSSIESEDTYPIDITLMTGKSKKEGEKK